MKRRSTMTRDELWDCLKQSSKGKFDEDRKHLLEKAKEVDDGGWAKHTDYHWSRDVLGVRLDYWPSRKKWRYNGKTQRGDMGLFLTRVEIEKNRVMNGRKQIRLIQGPPTKPHEVIWLGYEEYEQEQQNDKL